MNTTTDPEAPKLDPKPWYCFLCSDRFFRNELPKSLNGHETEFIPRHDYSQNREDYLNA